MGLDWARYREKMCFDVGRLRKNGVQCGAASAVQALTVGYRWPGALIRPALVVCCGRGELGCSGDGAAWAGNWLPRSQWRCRSGQAMRFVCVWWVASGCGQALHMQAWTPSLLPHARVPPHAR
jgi:hypothetical protein